MIDAAIGDFKAPVSPSFVAMVNPRQKTSKIWCITCTAGGFSKDKIIGEIHVLPILSLKDDPKIKYQIPVKTGSVTPYEVSADFTSFFNNDCASCTVTSCGLFDTD